MQIVKIDIRSLDERLQELAALKQNWEGIVLEQYEIKSSGASAAALKQTMAEFEQVRQILIELLNLTEAVLKNTEEVFVQTDDKIGRMIALIGSIETVVVNKDPNPKPSVMEAAKVATGAAKIV